MKTRITILLTVSLLLTAALVGFSQDFQRKVVEVPKVNPADITIDGKMDEAAWDNAARADLVTDTGYEIWTNKYYREAIPEPEYDALYGRMLWAKDTLFVFIHIDEFVNDSTDLFWAGQWTGDQLFVSVSSQLGIEMMGWYDGNSYLAPKGPYHFWILGDEVTLNGGNEMYVPEEYRCNFADSLQVFNAADIARWGVTIDKENGVWNVEMAIYNPNVAAQSSIGFNIGGSTGSEQAQEQYGDAYAYYTWQPNVPDDPYAVPADNDPGYYNLASSSHWAILNFMPGADDEYQRTIVEVPQVEASAITIDGMMDETAWENAAHADLITDVGYAIWTNKYYREAILEPEYDALYGRMLWALDTLYVFVHIDEFVNDSTDLFWAGQWTGDQLFVSISGQLGIEMMGWYDGNSYLAPEGPYHFWILGEDVTLNGGNEMYVPEEYRCNFADSLQVFNAADIARWGVTIDKESGVWNVEMAIYHPNVAAQASLGFNIGGSTGSSVAQEQYGDAYAYYTWQPNVPDDPYAVPADNDPGFYNLASSSHWALLSFMGSGTSDVSMRTPNEKPTQYQLSQNFPNPFNPETTIQFNLPQATKVTLRVYNTLGQVIATLIDSKAYTAGSYQVTWEAMSMPTGVYYYRLETGDRIETKKMVLLK